MRDGGAGPHCMSTLQTSAECDADACVSCQAGGVFSLVGVEKMLYALRPRTMYSANVCLPIDDQGAGNEHRDCRTGQLESEGFGRNYAHCLQPQAV